MEKFLGGHIFLVCSWIEALCTLMILAFEGLYPFKTQIIENA